MSYSVAGTEDGPEAEEAMEIPGFPKPHNPGGFTGNLQGHLEKLSSNAKSIHHVLEALCGGLDRLEKKIDTNSSQVESRLANIVHHMSGEADEDTMSAWGSLNSGLCSPAELGAAQSMRRRSSFGMQMSSFSEEFGPLSPPGQQKDQELVDAQLPETGRDGRMRTRSSMRDTVQHAMEKGLGDGGGEEKGEAGPVATPTDGVIDGEKYRENIPDNTAETSATVDAAVSSGGIAGSSQSPEAVEVPTLQSPITTDPSGGDDKAAVMETSQNALLTGSGSSIVDDLDPPRRSNQDDSDQSNGSARSGSSITGVSVPGEGGEEGEIGRREEVELPPPALSPEESVGLDSAVSDARYIARQRWVWAIGRVCQLVRRRKRKQFEIMSQRATDRTVRMGSRVSVVEKRLDETAEHLLLVGRLRDKSWAHTAQINDLSKAVTELRNLLGVEERFNGAIEATQTKVANMETALTSGLKDLEGRLASRHRELETSLEDEIRRNGVKLEDLDDRYSRSEEALRSAEERIGEVQEEVSAVTHSISEVERQLKLDEERLDSLENLKKAHQKRLSELRKTVDAQGGAVAAGVVAPMVQEPEVEETDQERMARFLKAAGVAAEFLATDLGKILDSDSNNGRRNSRGSSSSGSGGGTETVRAQPEAQVVANNMDTMDKLRVVSLEAAEFSRLCSSSSSIGDRGEESQGGLSGGGGSERSDAVAAVVERAETLCGRIEDLLSTEDGHGDHGIGGSSNKRRRSSSSASARAGELERQRSQGGVGGGLNEESELKRKNGSRIGGIVCPNGRKDLAVRLAAARDALLPVIEERTSVGSLRVALLGLAASVRDRFEQSQAADLLEARWNDLQSKMSGLDNSVSHIKDSLGGDGRLHRRSVSMGTGDGSDGDGGDRLEGWVTEDDLEERLGFKADVSWVQRELQRLWAALDSHEASRVVVASGTQGADGSRPRSAPSSNGIGGRDKKENDGSRNPETAGQEESDVDADADASLSLTPVSRMTSTSLPSAGVLSMGLGAGGGGRSSLTEGSSLIKDLLRKTCRLEQQMGSKADNDEVFKALSTVGNKLKKIGVIIPAIQEELSTKINRDDLSKLVALVSNGGSLSDGAPPGGGNNNTNSTNNGDGDIGAVLASRLNSKFRCLSCDRPLPALGPPGPPKLGPAGLSISGAGAPRSPQRTKTDPGNRLRLTAGGDASSAPSSPAMRSPTSEDVGDVAGWGGGGSSSRGGATDTEKDGVYFYGKGKDGGGRRRRDQRGGDQPGGRLEPLGANGEHMAGVLSRYPRMMPPPSRIRTAAGGGIGSRPASSSGGRV